MDELWVGADVGGTSTRVAVARTDGQVVGLATGGPGNPNGVGVDASAAEIRRTVEAALTGVEGTVSAVVFGLAGEGRVRGDSDFLRAAVPDSVPVLPRLVSDLVVAFCAATPVSDGYVVVSGTGSVAGRVEGDTLAGRRDGWGWMLGDTGSGFWLGREAVRVTLASLETYEEKGTPLGTLAQAVLERTGADSHAGLLHLCYLHPPTWLARLSVLVSEHADTDPVANDVVRRGTDLLAASVFDLVEAHEDPARRSAVDLTTRAAAPVVLAGSVLATPGPFSTRFRSLVDETLAHPVLTSTHPVVGALWVAGRSRARVDDETHARMASSVRTVGA